MLVFAAAALLSGGLADNGVPTTMTPAPTAAAQPTSDSSEGAAVPVRSEPSWPDAVAAVADLTVKGRAPRTGYDRSVFGRGWSDDDGDGCDTRDDILLRDLRAPVLRTGSACAVAGGTLDDPYTGKVIVFRRGVTSARVHIDHVVALSDAWQKGAQQWTDHRRLAFANDPLNLIAVDSQANISKGGSDAASWLPPAKSYRCTYVARQAEVKSRYDLAVTEAEKKAMLTVLSSCTAALPASSATPSAMPTCEPAYPTICLPPEGNSPDLNCSAISQRAFSVLRPDPYHLDGNDHDGVGCES
jgi:hypothetical protein